MSRFSRRGFALGLMAAGSLAACNNGIGSSAGATIDARVDATLEQMYTEFPGTRDLASRASGLLVIQLNRHLTL